MAYDRRRDILNGRSLPTITELEAGMPFFKDSIREDMIAFAESSLRRLPDNLDDTWHDAGYVAALRAMADGARDEGKSDRELSEVAWQLLNTLKASALSADRLRCRLYMNVLGGVPSPSATSAADSGKDVSPLIERLSDIYTGKAFPMADELLRGMPFFKDSLHWDMRTFAGMVIRSEREQGREEGRLTDRATRLKEAANDGFVTERDLAAVVRLLMSALPDDERQGRLRCRVYLATLGDRMSQILLAADAVSPLVANARAGDATEHDYELAQSALGWLAVFASGGNHPLLGGDRKPDRMGSPSDTALWHGRTVVHFLRGLPLRKGKPDRDGIAASFIEKDGDFLTETQVMDRLGIGFEDMDELVADRRLIAVPWRGNRFYPGFQFDGDGILEGLAAVLGSLAITDPWEALDWFLAANPHIPGTPLDALRAGRTDDVLRAVGRGPDGHAARYGIARKEWLIKKVGGAIEEELAANWLQVSVDHLRRSVDEGTFIGVEIDGRWMYPAFQMRDAMTVLTVREALAALPIRDPWRLLEWWLTHHLGLSGQTPLDHLMARRREAVLECARMQGGQQ